MLWIEQLQAGKHLKPQRRGLTLWFEPSFAQVSSHGADCSPLALASNAVTSHLNQSSLGLKKSKLSVLAWL